MHGCTSSPECSFSGAAPTQTLADSFPRSKKQERREGDEARGAGLAGQRGVFARASVLDPQWANTRLEVHPVLRKNLISVSIRRPRTDRRNPRFHIRDASRNLCPQIYPRARDPHVMYHIEALRKSLIESPARHGPPLSLFIARLPALGYFLAATADPFIVRHVRLLGLPPALYSTAFHPVIVYLAPDKATCLRKLDVQRLRLIGFGRKRKNTARYRIALPQEERQGSISLGRQSSGAQAHHWPSLHAPSFPDNPTYLPRAPAKTRSTAFSLPSVHACALQSPSPHSVTHIHPNAPSLPWIRNTYPPPSKSKISPARKKYHHT
ncbi:hypothetical protein EW146_g9390 [Bondarzewia mesenterica]|uniref:Uncharacterized protein n=1 Tax=Bondarzewia mesenterica TaxID=1095465 RepID=A0A4S4L880_9AGAM|nr:hypothetical protein EW146_g9390 [Bondarzewia mesenterica]